MDNNILLIGLLLNYYKQIVIFVPKIKIMITLNEQQLGDLKAFINKIPTEFGLPLLTFFGQLEHEQKEEIKTEE